MRIFARCAYAQRLIAIIAWLGASNRIPLLENRLRRPMAPSRAPPEPPVRLVDILLRVTMRRTMYAEGGTF